MPRNKERLKGNYKPLAAILLVCLLVFLFGYYLLSRQNQSPNFSDNPYTNYESRITARIGSYAPYAFIDKMGKLDGFVMDLTYAISRVMNIRIELLSRRLDAENNPSNSEEADVILCMADTSRNRAAYDLSTPYATHDFSIFSRADTPPTSYDKNFLARRDLVLSQDGVFLEILESSYPNIKPNLSSTAEAAFALLESGEYNYAIMETYIGEQMIRSGYYRDIILNGKTSEQINYCFAVLKGNSKILDIFNEGILILKNTGQLDKIENKWLEPRYIVSKNDSDNLKIYLFAVLGVLTCVIMGFYLWSYTLRKNVALQTRKLRLEVMQHRETEQKLLASQAQLVQADKMAAIGTLAAGIAHEVNNPNSLILLNLPFINNVLQDLKPLANAYYSEHADFTLAGMAYPKVVRNIDALTGDTIEASKRISIIVDDLKDFVRSPSATQEAYNLNDVLRTSLRLLASKLNKTAGFCETDCRDLPDLYGSPQKIEQVVINLLMNACEALPDKSKGIFISTRYDEQKQAVILEVVDQGCGIKDVDLPRLFDPFYTTKRDCGGTGLGLSICNTIINEHSGSLAFESEIGAGTRAILILPVNGNEHGRKNISGIQHPDRG